MAEPTTMRADSVNAVVLSVTTPAVATNALGTANPGQPGAVTQYRLVGTVDMWIAFGTAPTAAVETAGSTFLPANTPEVFDVRWGEKISAIAASPGKLSVCPMYKA